MAPAVAVACIIKSAPPDMDIASSDTEYASVHMHDIASRCVCEGTHASVNYNAAKAGVGRKRPQRASASAVASCFNSAAKWWMPPNRRNRIAFASFAQHSQIAPER